MNYKEINRELDEKIIEYIGTPINSTTKLNMKRDFESILENNNIYIDFNIVVNDLDLPELEFLPEADEDAKMLNDIFSSTGVGYVKEVK